MDNKEELIEFYKNEMVELKCQFQEKCDLIIKQKEEIHDLQALVASLKENNEGLSDMFTQFKTFSQSQQHELEFKLATLSVESADKDFQLDAIYQELRQIKKAYVDKEYYCQELEQKIRNNVRIYKYRRNLLTIQVFKVLMISHNFLKRAQDKVLKFKILIKMSLRMELNVSRLFKLEIHRKSSIKNKKQDIQKIMENLPSSTYKILYEEEFNKIKDTSNKKFEMMIWEKEVMSLFLEKEKNEKKIHERLAQFLRNSFPEQLRGKIWGHLVGNRVYIKKGLYEKLLNSIPSHPLVTQELLNLINKQITIYYSDLQRTFQIINEFQDADRLKDELRELLIIFSIFRPDIGYVQGMTYIAFMFLIRMPKQKAFKCFCNLMLKSRLLRSFYQFKSNMMDCYFQIFDQLLAEKLPAISKHLEQLAIPKQSFLVEWFYTVFARAFNLIVSSKVWDYFLYEGDVFLIRLSIAVLAVLEKKLLKSEYEEILLVIRNDAFQLDGEELFKYITKIKIEGNYFQNRLLNM